MDSQTKCQAFWVDHNERKRTKQFNSWPSTNKYIDATYARDLDISKQLCADALIEVFSYVPDKSVDQAMLKQSCKLFFVLLTRDLQRDHQIDPEAPLIQNLYDCIRLLPPISRHAGKAIAESAVHHDMLVNVQYMVQEYGYKEKEWLVALAAGHGHLNMIEWLVDEAKADLTSLHDEPLTRRVTVGDYVDFDFWATLKNASFVRAAAKGHLDVAKWFFARGANVRIGSNNAVILAAGNGHLETAKWLVSQGANLRANDDEALILACLDGHLNVLLWLEENGADLSAQSCTAIIEAASGGHLHILQHLVNRGLSLQARQNQALDIAARNGHLHIIKWLIINGVDIDIFANDNNAIISALACGHLETAKWLRKKGADINAHDGEAITLAAQFGHFEVVQWLIENGASASAYNNWAITGAAISGNIAIAELLVKHGANVASHNNRAIQIAHQFHRNEMVAWLEQHGASLEDENESIDLKDDHVNTIAKNNTIAKTNASYLHFVAFAFVGAIFGIIFCAFASW